MRTVQNSPCMRRLRQIGPFRACRESFVPERRCGRVCWESFIPDMPWTGACRANFVTGRVRRVPERVFSRSLVRRGDISAPTGRPARPFSLNRHTVVMQTRAASHSHAQPHAARHSHVHDPCKLRTDRNSLIQPTRSRTTPHAASNNPHAGAPGAVAPGAPSNK